MATISQRITLEGGDDIRKQLDALAKAASAAFDKISEAAEKIQIDAATQQSFADLADAGKKLTEQFGGVAKAAAQAAPPVEETGKSADDASKGFAKLGEETGKTAEGLAQVSDASKKLSGEVAKSGEAAEKSSVGWANLGLNVVRTGASLGTMAAGMTSAAAATTTAAASVVGATAAVGTLALTLGTTLVSAIGAVGVAVVGLTVTFAQWASADARLSDTLEHLARQTGNIKQSFTGLQVGQAAFEQVGLSAEKFRAVIANVAQELGKFDAGAAIQKSADAISSATLKVLETEKVLLEVQTREGASPLQQARLQVLTEQIAKMKEVNDLTVAQSAANDAAAARTKALANNLAAVAKVVAQIEAAKPGAAFDPLVTADTKLDAVKARLAEVVKAGGDVSQSLLKIIANMQQADATATGKAFGLSETDVDRVRRYGADVTKIDNLFARIRAAGVLISPETAATFDRMAESSQRLDSAWARLKQAWASTIFSQLGATATTAFNNMTASVVEFTAQVVEAFNRIGGQFFTTLGQIAQGWGSIFSMAIQGWGRVFSFIGTGVTTAVGGAWQWIVDTFNSVLASLSAAASSAYQAVVSFVTTPVANAWQWIKDTFNSVWNSIKAAFGGSSSAAPSEGFAGGGRVGGRGTGTSDSNLAWVSRGEFISPARVVAQPGVLAFLEALRRSGGDLRAVLDGMGRFALGGLVPGPLSLPAITGGGMNNVTINFPGLPEITGLRASSDVVDELRKAAALAQVRSGGRKPSRWS